MKKESFTRTEEDEMRDEYDFADGVRGKYAEAMKSGSNLVLLEPEIAAAFPDSESVNDALRQLLAIANRTGVNKQPG